MLYFTAILIQEKENLNLSSKSRLNFRNSFQSMFYKFEIDDDSAIDLCINLLISNNRPRLLLDIDGVETIKSILIHPELKKNIQKVHYRSLLRKHYRKTFS